MALIKNWLLEETSHDGIIYIHNSLINNVPPPKKIPIKCLSYPCNFSLFHQIFLRALI